MTDRKLLELAAKAAGIELQPVEIKNVSYQGDDKFIGYMCDCPRGWFSPLTDDGDALRLAVNLDMEVQINRVDSLTVVLTGYTARDLKRTVAEHDQDPYAATRRAIVRAAAEIGKELK